MRRLKCQRKKKQHLWTIEHRSMSLLSDANLSLFCFLSIYIQTHSNAKQTGSQRTRRVFNRSIDCAIIFRRGKLLLGTSK